jgi:hypothetical protein
VRSRPITVEKMDTMKVESKGASIMPGAATGPVIVPQPIAVPLSIDQDATNSTAETPVKAYVTPNVNPPTNSLPFVPKPQTGTTSASQPIGVPRVVPRSPIVNSGSAGMSDAVVDPAQAQ